MIKAELWEQEGPFTDYLRARYGLVELYNQAEKAWDELILAGARVEDFDTMRRYLYQIYGDEKPFLALLIVLNNRRQQADAQLGDSEHPIQEMRKYYTDDDIVALFEDRYYVKRSLARDMLRRMEKPPIGNTNRNGKEKKSWTKKVSRPKGI